MSPALSSSSSRSDLEYNNRPSTPHSPSDPSSSKQPSWRHTPSPLFSSALYNPARVLPSAPHTACADTFVLPRIPKRADRHRPCTPSSSSFTTPSTPSTSSHHRRRSSAAHILPVTPTRPTLAMSLQVHAPVPTPSTPTSPRHRPVSPPPRPSSRSERLLRDTLRRAEAHDRLHSPPRNACGSDCDCDDLAFFAAPLAYSQSHQPPRSPLHRASNSVPDVPALRKRAHTHNPAGTQEQEQRGREKQSRGRRLSAQPAPAPAAREASPLREWAWSSLESTSTHDSPSSPSPFHTPPHQHSHPYGPAPHSASSSSTASSTPPPTPPHATAAFDAQSAAAKLRAVNGYVSFAAVEGLGMPPGLLDADDEGEQDEGARGLRAWWRAFGRARSGSVGSA